MPDIDKHCFVIGPIGDENSPERIHADWLLSGIIFPVFQKNFPDWMVERADKIPTPGMISAQIINRLHDVALVIADLSFHNANAFYEMSIRHKVGKPIIHMIRKGEKIPFDVIPHRAIPFSVTHPNDLEDAQKLLRAAVEEATKEGFEPDNPIMHARGRLEFEQKATPAMKVLADDIATINSRLDTVEFFVDRLTGTRRLYSEDVPPPLTPWTSHLRRTPPNSTISPSGDPVGSDATPVKKPGLLDRA